MDCQTSTHPNHFQWSKWLMLLLKFLIWILDDSFDWWSIFIQCIPIFRRTRSFLCGIATANHYLVASLITKTYYNIEIWLSLPGAILFYAVIGVIGYASIKSFQISCKSSFLGHSFDLTEFSFIFVLYIFQSCRDVLHFAGNRAEVAWRHWITLFG